VIRADNRPSTLDELKKFANVKLQYLIQEGKKVTRGIFGTRKKQGKEESNK
jgi:hypothetical protein